MLSAEVVYFALLLTSIFLFTLASFLTSPETITLRLFSTDELMSFVTVPPVNSNFPLLIISSASKLSALVTMLFSRVSLPPMILLPRVPWFKVTSPLFVTSPPTNSADCAAKELSVFTTMYFEPIFFVVLMLPSMFVVPSPSILLSFSVYFLFSETSLSA